MKKILIFILTLHTSFCYSQKTKITVNVSGIKKIQGAMFVKVLNEKEKELENRIIPLTNNNCSFEITGVLEQKIAIKVFQDLNNDLKLTANSIGFPTEPWGVSNNIKPILGPPNFGKMLIKINKPNKNITINLQ